MHQRIVQDNYLQWKKNEYCQIWLIHAQFTLLCLYLKRFKVVTNLNDMQNGIGFKQQYFLVYTLWFASQIEFSDWDWRALNIISRTIAVIHQFNVYLICSKSSRFFKSVQEKLSSWLHVSLSIISLQRITWWAWRWFPLSRFMGYFQFPLVTASHNVPEPPQSSGFQNLKLKQAAGKNYGSRKEQQWKFPDLSQADKASRNSLCWEETKAWVKLT